MRNKTIILLIILDNNGKRFCFKISHYKSMGAIFDPGVWPFGPQGLDWYDLCRGPFDTALKHLSLMVSEDILSISHYRYTVKPVKNDHSQKDRKLVFKTNYH